MTLPTGLVRLPDGRVVKHPDREVADRLDLVFETHLAKKSLAQVVLHFRQHDPKVPRRDGFGDVQWKRATVANLGTIAQIPAYAGTFVYGRSK